MTTTMTMEPAIALAPTANFGSVESWRKQFAVLAAGRPLEAKGERP